MIKVLFICHGNICRSTMAEFVMKEFVKRQGRESEFYISSAATSREEIGNDVHYGTRRKLEEEGIPCSHHRAVQVVPADYDKYDYLIVMDENNIRNLKRIIPDDPEKKIHKLLAFAGSARDIADPWYTGNFDDTFDDITAGIIGLLNRI